MEIDWGSRVIVISPWLLVSLRSVGVFAVLPPEGERQAVEAKDQKDRNDPNQRRKILNQVTG